MNRAARRRQAQAQNQASGAPATSPSVRRSFDDAVAHHRAGRLDDAETRYHQVLAEDPAHADAAHLLGLIAYRQSRYDRALEYITRAIQHHATTPLYWYNQGLVYQALRRLPEAEHAYRQALSLKADYVEALGNLGNVLRERGDLTAARDAYERVLTLRPDDAEGYNNAGVVLKELGKTDEAERAWQRALTLNPNNAEASYNLGAMLFERERVDEAMTRLQHAVAVKPQYAKAHHALGLAKLWTRDVDGALHEFRASADVTHNQGGAVHVTSLPASRVKHDAEQMRYLAERGVWRHADPRYVAALRALHRTADGAGEGNPRVTLTPDDAQALAPSLNHILHYADNPALPGGAVNHDVDARDIERRYHASRPELVVVDTFLRPDALAALRRFCRESTIWKKDYDDGYIGAFLGEGFSSPLLLQMADELPAMLPGIFGRHRLLQAWAFKQDSTRRPLNIHADAAAVNVNFWITEDEANADPSRGGLIVWDKEAPRDWDFTAYNSTAFQPKIRDFLRDHGASPKTIPYRANRAILFNSDLFHESDTCVFHDTYESRRINVTLLYGRRR